MKPCALIPVYNNGATVGGVVRACLELGLEVLVVSDGSTDGSDGRAEEAGARVIRLPENGGKGAALLAGMRRAHELGFTHAVTLDADGQHPPKEALRLLNAAKSSPQALWVGVRRMETENVPTSSRSGRAITNFWATVNGWQRCRDAQSGLRVYPIESVFSLPCRETRFTFEMEVLVRASWAGIPIAHLDVDVRYFEEGVRVTHFKKGRDNLSFSWLSFRMFLGMLWRAPKLLFQKLLRG